MNAYLLRRQTVTNIHIYKDMFKLSKHICIYVASYLFMLFGNFEFMFLMMMVMTGGLCAR